MAQIIKGDELMLFKGGNALAFATSHTLTVSGNTIDISSKDHGFWGASEVGKITWEITTENLYTEDDYDALFDAMLNKEEITIVFGYASNYNVNGLRLESGDQGRPTAWVASSGKGYKGQAVITSLTTNANSGENATFSATFTGKGAIVNLKNNASVEYVYTAVSSPATGSDPHASLWYEKSGTGTSEDPYVYTLSADTVVDSNKTYYTQSVKNVTE